MTTQAATLGGFTTFLPPPPFPAMETSFGKLPVSPTRACPASPSPSVGDLSGKRSPLSTTTVTQPLPTTTVTQPLPTTTVTQPLPATTVTPPLPATTVTPSLPTTTATPSGQLPPTHPVVIPPAPPPPPPPLPSIGPAISSSGVLLPPPPPPPPPRLGSTPPPPPGPPSLSPFQRVPLPKTKLRRFQWTKISLTRVAAGKNVWSLGETQSNGYKPNFERMEQLFSCVVSSSPTGSGRSKKSVDSLPASSKEQKIGEVNILDSRRSLNLNIFLRQFRSSHEDLLRSLTKGEAEKWGADKLRSLIKFLPEEEEMKQLEEFKGDHSRLGCAERFCVELASISNYRVRIETMLLKEEFIHSIDWLKPSIDAVIITARDLRESHLIRDVLHSVLVLGNFLNAGGYAGEAGGFRLNSLTSLGDFKANNSRITFIHVIAMEAEKRNIEMLKFHRELKYLKEAAQWSVESIRSDIQSLREKLDRMKQLLEQTDSDFRQQMERFMEYASEELSALVHDVDELESFRLELAQYFCEDEASFQLDECIRIFNTFVDMLVKANQENRERQLLEEKAEQRRRIREAQMNARRVSVVTPGSAVERRSIHGRELPISRLNGFESSPLVRNEESPPGVRGFPRNYSDVSLFPRSASSTPKTHESPSDATDGCGVSASAKTRNELRTASSLPESSGSDPDSSAATPINADQSGVNRDGSFNRKRRSRDMTREDDLFSYLVQSSTVGAELPDGYHGGSIGRQQQRRRKPINFEATRERINPVTIEAGTLDSSTAAPPLSSQKPPITVPSKVPPSQASPSNCFFTDDTLTQTGHSTHTFSQTRVAQNHPNTLDSTVNGHSGPFAQESLSFTHKCQKIPKIQMKSEPPSIQISDCDNDSQLTDLQLIASDFGNPSDLNNGYDVGRLSVTYATNSLVSGSGSLENNDSQGIKIKDNVNIGLCLPETMTNGCAIQTFGIDQIIQEVMAEKSQPENVVAFVDPCVSMQEHPFARSNTSSSRSPLRSSGTSVSANGVRKSTLDVGLRENDMDCRLDAVPTSPRSQTVRNELDVSSEGSVNEIKDWLETSKLNSLPIQDDSLLIVSEGDVSISCGEEKTETTQQADSCSLGEPQQRNKEETDLDPRKNSNGLLFQTGGNGEEKGKEEFPSKEETESFPNRFIGRKSLGLSTGGKYESNSLERCNPKKRPLLAVTRDRSVDDAVVPSSTLRSELELEELNLKVHEFQSKTDNYREGMKTKLKRLSLFYSGSNDEGAKWSLNSPGKTMSARCAVYKETSCIGSSISSLEDVTTQSNASLNDDMIKLRPPKQSDLDPRTKDEGFESESLSDPNTSSQRSSMCSAPDFDPTVARLELASACGTSASSREMSDGSDDGTVAGGSGCGAIYFSRSIDSVVVKPELTPVEVDLDEAALISPSDHLSDDVTLAAAGSFSIADQDGTNSTEDAVASPIQQKTGRNQRSGTTLSKIPFQRSTIPKQASAPSGTTARLSLPLSHITAKKSNVSSLCTPRKINLDATPSAKDPERPKKPQQRPSSAVPFTKGILPRSGTQPKLSSTRDASIRPGMHEFVRGSSPRTAILPPALRNNKKAAAELRSARLPQGHTASDSLTVQTTASIRSTISRSFTSTSPAKKDPAKQSKLPLGVGTSSMRESASESAQNRAGRRSGMTVGTPSLQTASRITKPSSSSSKLRKPTVGN